MSQNTSDINTCTPAKINTQKYQKLPCDLIYIIQVINQSDKTNMKRPSIIITGSSTVTKKLHSRKQHEHNYHNLCSEVKEINPT